MAKPAFKVVDPARESLAAAIDHHTYVEAESQRANAALELAQANLRKAITARTLADEDIKAADPEPPAHMFKAHNGWDLAEAAQIEERKKAWVAANRVVRTVDEMKACRKAAEEAGDVVLAAQGVESAASAKARAASDHLSAAKRRRDSAVADLVVGHVAGMCSKLNELEEGFEAARAELSHVAGLLSQYDAAHVHAKSQASWALNGVGRITDKRTRERLAAWAAFEDAIKTDADAELPR